VFAAVGGNSCLILPGGEEEEEEYDAAPGASPRKLRPMNYSFPDTKKNNIPHNTRRPSSRIACRYTYKYCIINTPRCARRVRVGPRVTTVHDK